MICNQSTELLNEWNAKITGGLLNSAYVLDSTRSTLVAEKFDGQTYSRIHRRGEHLILEERAKGSMYPRCWEISQDFSGLEAEFKNKFG